MFEKINELKNKNLFLNILFFSIPLMLTSFLQLFYNAADLIVVGSFAGDKADVSLAAVGSNSPLISLIFNVFFGLSVGANIVMANAYGAKDVEKGQRVLHSSVLLSLIASVIIGVCGYFLAPYLERLMKVDDEVIEYAVIYLQIYLLGSPANLLFNFAQSNLRAIGNTMTPLIILLCAGLLNVGLNLLFVICFHMAVEGVAYATIASQYASAIAVMVVLIRSKDPYVHFSFYKLKFSSSETRELIIHGLPAGIQGSIFSLSNVLLQSAVNSLGTYAMAGKSAAFSIDNFVYAGMNTFYTATIVFMGQGYGAKNIEKMKKTYIYCNIYVILVWLIMGLFILVLNQPLISMYTTTEQSVASAREIMIAVLPFYFMCGMNEVACGALRSLKHPLIPTIVSLLGICGSRIIWIYTVFEKYHTCQVLFVSYPLSWLIALTIHIIFYYCLRNRSFKVCLNVNDENKGNL